MHARLLLLRERVPDLCSGCLSENVGRSSRMKLKEALLYREFLVLLRRFAVIERLIWEHATFSMYWLYLVLFVQFYLSGQRYKGNIEEYIAFHTRTLRKLK